MNLPYDVLYLVFDLLNPDDIYRFSGTNKAARGHVATYITQKYSLMALLVRYFDYPTEAERFWSLMSSTGMLIAGSSAVQFFDTTFYPESDLDIYIEDVSVPEVSGWLSSVGYCIRIGDSEYDAISTTENQTTDSKPTKDQKTHTGDTFAAMTKFRQAKDVKVHDFEHPSKKKKIQLISCGTCPLQIVLGFHSTAVLNIITYAKAYSLFPRSTFLHRRSLLQTISSAHVLEATSKYSKRGWEMIPGLSIAERFDPSSTFSPGIRALGDAKCWTICFNRSFDKRTTEAIESNSWLATLDSSGLSSMNAWVFTSDRLEHGYLLPPCVSYKEVAEKFGSLKESEASKPTTSRYLDACWPELFGHHH